MDMTSRTDQGKYMCNICGQLCRDLYNQREHLMSHMTRDEKFRKRLDRFVDANVFKDPNSNKTTCVMCGNKPIGALVKKHFLSKHLRVPIQRYFVKDT